MTAKQLSVTQADVVAALLRHATLKPEKVFCRLYKGGDATAITFADLARDSAQVAAFLRRNTAIQEGEVVVIILPHGPELLWSFLGVMWRRAVPTFMPFPSSKQDPNYYWRSHAQLFAKIGARNLISSTVYREQIERHLDLEVLYIEDIGALLGSQADDDILPIEPESTALLQHSSGTTGLKKGVKLSHAAIVTQVESYARELGFAEHHVIASWLPLYHDMGLIACFMMPLLVGASVVMIDPFEWVGRPWLILDSIERHQANFVWMPNFAFRHVVRTAPRQRVWDLSSAIALINCSEPCKPAEFEAFVDRFESSGVTPRTLQVCYAMAENVFAVTQTASGEVPRVVEADTETMDGDGIVAPPAQSRKRRRLLSCGRPLAETGVRIHSSDGDLLPDRHVGEIVIRSPSLFSGYNQLAELTARKLVDGWYHTGDLGFLDGGELFVTGRLDDLIIVYGRNYYAHEIEEAANLVAGVAPGRLVAFAVDSVATGTAEVVVLAELQHSADPAAMRRQIKEVVLDHLGLTVQTVAFLERGELAKSTAGKISRDRNKSNYLNRLSEEARA